MNEGEYNPCWVSLRELAKGKEGVVGRNEEGMREGAKEAKDENKRAPGGGKPGTVRSKNRTSSCVYHSQFQSPRTFPT